MVLAHCAVCNFQDPSRALSPPTISETVLPSAVMPALGDPCRERSLAVYGHFVISCFDVSGRLTKGPAKRNDFVNDIVNDARADAIFATLKNIVDDETSSISSTISLRVAGP